MSGSIQVADEKRSQASLGFNYSSRLSDSASMRDAAMLQNAAPATFVEFKPIAYGDKGPHVTAMQLALRRAGCQVEPDGDFGTLTREAIRQFQINKNITPALGNFGPITAQRLTECEREGRPVQNVMVSTEQTPPALRRIAPGRICFQQTGYVNGQEFEFTATRVDGFVLEAKAAAAFDRMQKAAAADGVSLEILSAFRTNEEQTELYNSYKRGLPGYRPANPPGYSNHQNGVAIDFMDCRSTKCEVYNWLKQHAAEFGFVWPYRKEKESQHWEYRPERCSQGV